MARCRGPCPAVRNARRAARGRDPPAEDLHGHRARRHADPQAPPRDPVRAVRARTADHAGWHGLELPGVGRGHGLRRSWQGRHGLGHGRQRVHRPADGLRPGHPRPRRRAGGRLRQRTDASRGQLLAHVGGRGPGDGAGQGADRLGGQGPDDGVRHRGDDARDADRARLHRSRQDREVRGPVPRRPRLRPDQRLARRHVRSRRSGRAGPRWPGAAASRTRSPTRSSRPATTRSRRSGRCSSRAARRSPRSSSSPSSATPRGSCPSPASTRRCAR